MQGHERPRFTYAADYWITLARLLKGPRALRDGLDRPLEEVIAKSRWATLWSVIVLVVAILIGSPRIHNLLAHTEQQHGTLAPLFIALGTLVAVCLTFFVSYGLLRLYTLISHNLTTNLFKVRGQRLRLLHTFATVLSLTPFVGLAFALHMVVPVVSTLLYVLTGLYTLYLTERVYRVIFHRNTHTLDLVIGGTLVSCFVLAICGVAVAAALGVIGFLFAVIVRSALH